MKLEDLEIYQISMQLGDDIWNIVTKWGYFEKIGLGKQLTEASDSIAANISEGYGRLSSKDNRRFCFIARGSLYETSTWLVKAKQRNLIEEETFKALIAKTTNLQVKLWNYIQSIEKRIEG